MPQQAHKAGDWVVTRIVQGNVVKSVKATIFAKWQSGVDYLANETVSTTIDGEVVLFECHTAHLSRQLIDLSKFNPIGGMNNSASADEFLDAFNNPIL